LEFICVFKLSELQRQNLIVKFCLGNPNKTKGRLLSTLNYCLLEYKNPTNYRKIKRLEKSENVEGKTDSCRKCVFSLSKPCAALNKQKTSPSTKSYRKFWPKIQVHHNTVKKYLTKMVVHWCTVHIQMPTSTSKVYSKTPQKGKNRVLAWFGVCTLHKWEVAAFKNLNWLRPIEKKSLNVTQLKPIKNVWASLKRMETLFSFIKKKLFKPFKKCSDLGILYSDNLLLDNFLSYNFTWHKCTFWCPRKTYTITLSIIYKLISKKWS
jgi:hypothetical protein